MRTASILLCLAAAAFADSKNPPEGPPWERDLLAAQKKGLEEGKPVFFYFTKTY